MKSSSKYFSCSIVFSSFVMLSVVSTSVAAGTTVTYDIKQSAHAFEGFGSMVWNSADSSSNLGGSQVQRLTDMHNNSPGLRIVRINHEARPDNASCFSAVPTDYNYDQYLAYWDMCGDAGLTGASSIEPSSQDLDYMLMGTVPTSFKDNNNNFLTTSLQIYADYLAAGVADFSRRYGKCPKYVDMSNEPDSSSSAYFEPANYDHLAVLFHRSLHKHTACRAQTQVVGAGVSKIDWSGHRGDPYTQDLTNHRDLGHWDVHAWIRGNSTAENSSTGQAALLSKENWSSWAVGVARQDPNKPIIIGAYASFADRFYYGGGNTAKDSVTFATPIMNAYDTAAYTTAFGVRIYHTTISLIGANVGPKAVPPYGASAVVYWQAADQFWMASANQYLLADSGDGYSLIDVNTNYQANPQVVTPVYLSLSPLYELVSRGSKVIKADQRQDQSRDVFSVVFYDAATKCATVAIANGTYADRSTSLKDARTTVIEGLPKSSRVKSVIAKRYRQGAGSQGCTPGSNCYPILEDIKVDVRHHDGITTFTTPYQGGMPGLPMHSHLTTQICYK